MFILEFIIVFPVFVWIIEIIEGYILIFMYGKNMAWNYYGNDVYFSGTIKLGFWKYWFMGGLIYAPGLYLIKNLNKFPI